MPSTRRKKKKVTKKKTTRRAKPTPPPEPQFTDPVTLERAELKLVMRAARRTLDFLMRSDTMTTGGLYVETEEFLAAYKAAQERMKV